MGEPNAEDAGNSPFVAVRLSEDAATAPRRATALLRMRHRNGHVLEFGAWPPPEILAMILSEKADAA